MLICCPKCHSIYEIPDNLISKTGQNFRCQACANVWHAMREDALGYTNKEDTPYVEAIDVSEPPNRNYPANKKVYNIPADTKSGKKTYSSDEIIKKEGNPDYIPHLSAKKDDDNELKLTSDTGTSFTIRTVTEEEDTDTKRRPYLYNPIAEELTVSAADRLLPEKPFKGYKKTYTLLFLVAIAALLLFFRREVTAIFPVAEDYYNRVHLSGIDNPEYLEFQDIMVTEETNNGKTSLKVTASIYNNSYYTTTVPMVIIKGVDTPFRAEQVLLKGHEKTSVEAIVPLKGDEGAKNISLSFQK